MNTLDRQRPAVLIDANASLKRIAWAYGCAKKGSAEETLLENLLRLKVAAENGGSP